MANEMRKLKETANAHMRRDLEGGGKWVCSCEACKEIRSLVGMDKMVDVWPLVRQIRDAESGLEREPDGPERQRLLERYLTLYDKLADQMAG